MPAQRGPTSERPMPAQSGFKPATQTVIQQGLTSDRHAMCTKVNPTGAMPNVTGPNAPVIPRSWADMVGSSTVLNTTVAPYAPLHQSSASVAIDNDGYQQVQYRKPRPAPLLGKKPAAETEIKGVAKKMTVFVSRLEKSTTEEDLKNHLKKSGISNCYCKKLSGNTEGGRECETCIADII